MHYGSVVGPGGCAGLCLPVALCLPAGGPVAQLRLLARLASALVSKPGRAAPVRDRPAPRIRGPVPSSSSLQSMSIQKTLDLVVEIVERCGQVVGRFIDPRLHPRPLRRPREEPFRGELKPRILNASFQSV